MRASGLVLAAVLPALAAGAAQASPFIATNVATASAPFDPNFTNTPGQAAASTIELQGRGIATGTRGTSCVVFPDPGFFCDLPAQPMNLSLDLSGSGLVATGTAKSGNDHAGTSLTVSSSGTNLPAFEFVQFNIIATDRQRLRFDVAGEDLPELLEVDMNFSVYAELTDRSNVTSGMPYLPQTSASINLLEAGSFPPDLMGAGFAPFQAEAKRTSEGIIDGTNMMITLMLKPNVEYWLLLESQSVLSLTSGPGLGFSDTRDYAGLDLEMNSWADPTFALSAAFAAEFPDIAANLTINRVAVVPVPAALPLFLSALGLVALWRRRSGSRMH